MCRHASGPPRPPAPAQGRNQASAVPPRLRKNRSVARARSAAGMPGPRSCTTTVTCPAAWLATSRTVPPGGENFNALSSKLTTACPMRVPVAMHRQCAGLPHLGHRCFQQQLQPPLLRWGRRRGRPSRASKGRQVQIGKRRTPGPRFDLGNAHQGFEHGGDVVQIADRPAYRGPQFVDPSGHAPRHPHSRARGPRDRRAQVVGDAVGHLAHPIHQPRDAVQHVVDRLGQPIELVAAAAQPHPAAQIALRDRLRPCPTRWRSCGGTAAASPGRPPNPTAPATPATTAAPR